MKNQRAYLPIKTLNLTQGYGSQSSTHKLSYALDFGGVQDVFAPFDCKITKLYQPSDTKNHANTVWLTSTNKVLSPNGSYDYLTMSITHPSEITSMKLGATYKQGAKICTTQKMTGLATGPHIHLELAKGTTAGWSQQKSGTYSEYVILNKVKPEEYLFVSKDSTIKNAAYKGVTYKLLVEPDEPIDSEETNVSYTNYTIEKGDTLSGIASKYGTTTSILASLNNIKDTNKIIAGTIIKIPVQYTTGNYQTLDEMYVRSGAGTNYSIKKVSDLTADGKKNATSTNSSANAVYKKGTVFTALEIIMNGSEVWAKSPSGYICIKGSTGTVYCKKI